MNRWKIAFWCCFVLMISVSIFAVYTIIDQAVMINYHKEDFKFTENDLDEIIDLVNHTDLTKSEIEKSLQNHSLYEFMDFETDTISLNRVLLIFEKDSLKTIKKQ